MYESFFHLSARPFLVPPLAERYFPAAASEYARETAARCVERAEGPAVIMGAAGTGKSMVCQVLADRFRSQFRVAMLASARLCTRRALLQNILFELRLPYREREEGELRLSLIDFLDPNERCPHGLLLIVDEAHALPLRLLEELRMLTNLVRDGQPRVRLVLAGNLTFDERLASPRLESFNQRLAARCYLQPMNRDETCAYIRAQIRAVNGDPQRILSEDALLAIFRATDGIPRLVNQLGDHVLMMAADHRLQRIDAESVEEAWADLQQLPTPWSGDQTPAPGDHDILEFGELDQEMLGELDGHDDRSLSPVMDTEVPQPASDEWGTAENTEEVDPPPSRREELEEHEPRTDKAPRVAAVEQTDNAPDRPAESGRAAGKPHSIKRIFHRAHDPFQEPFEREEVVIGSLVAGGTETVISPPTSMDQGRNPTTTIPFRAPDSTPHETSHESTSASVCDPVVPDSADVPISCSFVELVEDAPASSLPGDDRDLLEIYDDEACDPSCPPRTAVPKPKRREYRQLFANLRARS